MLLQSFGVKDRILLNMNSYAYNVKMIRYLLWRVLKDFLNAARLNGLNGLKLNEGLCLTYIRFIFLDPPVFGIVKELKNIYIYSEL